MVPKILAPDVHALYKTLLSVSRPCEYSGLSFPRLCSITGKKKGGFVNVIKVSSQLTVS